MNCSTVDSFSAALLCNTITRHSQFIWQFSIPWKEKNATKKYSRRSSLSSIERWDVIIRSSVEFTAMQCSPTALLIWNDVPSWIELVPMSGRWSCGRVKSENKSNIVPAIARTKHSAYRSLSSSLRNSNHWMRMNYRKYCGVNCRICVLCAIRQWNEMIDVALRTSVQPFA